MCSNIPVYRGLAVRVETNIPPRRRRAALAFLGVLLAASVHQAAAVPVLPTPVPVDQLESDPYRNVGLVRTDSFGQDPTILGSGWVAGDRVVASAAHVFFVDETLGWNRNRWYWKRAALPGEFWYTYQMQQPRTYRVLAGYAEAVASELQDPGLFLTTRNRDGIALMFYRSATDAPPPARAVDSLGGTGTYSIVGYPGELGGVDVGEIQMYAHIGGHPATFTLSDGVAGSNDWGNALYRTTDIATGQGGSGGPVFKWINGEWEVVGSLLAGTENVDSYSRAIDEEFENLLQNAIADSTVAGPGQLLWETETQGQWFTNPVIRADGSIIFAATFSRVIAVDSTGVEIWSREVPVSAVDWLAEAPDGRILAGSSSQVASLDGSTGSVQWIMSPGGSISSGAIGESGEVYAASGRYVSRISPSGTLDWGTDIPLQPPYVTDTLPVVGPDGTVYLVANERLLAINPDTGAVKWQTDGVDPISYQSLAVGGDGSITVLIRGGVRRLEPDGSTRWTYTRGDDGWVSIMLRGDGSIALVRGNGYGVDLLRSDGTFDRGVESGYGTRSVTEDEMGNLYVGTYDGVIAYDPSGNQLWRNGAGVGFVHLGNPNFVVAIGNAYPTPQGIRVIGTAAGAAPDTWQPEIGGANGARRAANSLPRAPRIVTAPPSTESVIGYRLKLTVTAEGSFPMTFEWRRDGVLLGDQVGQTLNIANATEADSGNYTVTVRNKAGEVSSQPVLVTVRAARFGDRLWTTQLDCGTPPAVAADGTIYALVRESIPGDSYHSNFVLVSLDELGNEVWRKTLGPGGKTDSGRPPIIGDDGRVYAVVPGSIFAISSAGTQLWENDLTSSVDNDWPTLSLSRENGVFYKNWSYLGYVGPDGMRRWERSDLNVYGMQVRRDGKMVIATGSVISTSGQVETLATGSDTWGDFKFIGPNDEWITTSAPSGAVTLDSSGVVISRNLESGGGVPLFMRNDGEVVTDRFQIEPFMGTGSLKPVPPGNGSMLGILEGNRMLWAYGDGRVAVFDPNGNKLAEAATILGYGYDYTIAPHRRFVGGSPLTGYALDWNLANSPWPRPLADARNTNRAPVDFEINAPAPQSVAIRGRNDPVNPDETYAPYYDSTMQAYVGYGTNLVAAVYGSGPFDFVWSKNGQPVEGASGGELKFASPNLSDAGSYTVSVTNAAGSTVSQTFTLNVGLPAAVTPGTYVRMWKNPASGEMSPCLFTVTSDRHINIELFGPSGRRGAAKLGPDGYFYNLQYGFDGTLSGSALILNDSEPVTLPGVAVSGAAPNGLPAGIYRGHTLGPTGFPVTAVVFVDGSFSWMQGSNYSRPSTAAGSFQGTSSSCALQVGVSPFTLEYTVNADASGALVASLSNSGTQITGFSAVWTDRPEVERFANLSTRGFVTPSQAPMIVGFYVGGSSDHSMLVRGVGPSLGDYGVKGTLDEPRLRFMNSKGQQLAQSLTWGLETDWQDLRDTAARVGAFPLLDMGADAALHMLEAPGSYTALVDGADGGSGVALVEVYEDQATSGGGSRLRNLSTRGLAGLGEHVLIGGFVITGTVPKSLLIRAVGPSLAPYAGNQFTVAKNPRIRLFKGSDSVNPIAVNDDFGTGDNDIEVREVSQRVGAFPLIEGSKDAAMVVALKPGLYTAVVDNLTPEEGIALLEIYEIPPK